MAQKISSKLELVFITYNRSELLERTLNDFVNSPFKDCPITILNNCSTDSTLDILHGFKDKFSNFKIISNQFNIGGDANILRALEVTKLDYIWIVCDDDFYDFTYCDDVIDCVVNERVDLINMGAHSDFVWDKGGQLTGSKKLYVDGYSFFKSSSFVPNNLFKKDAFLPFIIDAYKNITNMYPHMPFLLSFYELDKSIYIAKHRIVSAGIGEQQYARNSWLQGWLNTSRLLRKKVDQRNCFFDQWNARTNFSRIRNFYSILVLVFQRRQHTKTAWGVFLLFTFFQKIIIFFGFFPYLLFRFCKHLFTSVNFPILKLSKDFDKKI